MFDFILDCCCFTAVKAPSKPVQSNLLLINPDKLLKTEKFGSADVEKVKAVKVSENALKSTLEICFKTSSITEKTKAKGTNHQETQSH